MHRPKWTDALQACRLEASGVVGTWQECDFNPLALELDIYSLAHHLCKM